MPLKFVFVPMGYEDNIIESKLFLEWTCPLGIRILCILPIFFTKLDFSNIQDANLTNYIRGI